MSIVKYRPMPKNKIRYTDYRISFGHNAYVESTWTCYVFERVSVKINVPY